MGIVRRAVSVLGQGGVIVFPTTGLYGLGVDALNDEAVERVFEIKARARNKPIPIAIRDVSALAGVVARIPETAEQIIDRFWPGKITIVFEARPHLSGRLTAGSGKIGVRQPRHAAASALTKGFKNPITATSANISGHPGVSRISDLDASIKKNVGLILDAGDLKGGVGSTICDVTTDPPALLREGAVNAEDLSTTLGLKVCKVIDNYS